MAYLPIRIETLAIVMNWFQLRFLISSSVSTLFSNWILVCFLILNKSPLLSLSLYIFFSIFETFPHLFESKDKEESISYQDHGNKQKQIQKERSFKEIWTFIFSIVSKVTSINPHVWFVQVLHIFPSNFINAKCQEAYEQWHSLCINGKPEREYLYLY